MSLATALPKLLVGAGDGHLLMVHPGHVDEALIACDSLTAPRQIEWEALMAADMPHRLASLGFVIENKHLSSLTGATKSCQTPPP
jgi:predicted glycoside hydrolase/deacetylase ChbG (UPF0249 family)